MIYAKNKLNIFFENKSKILYIIFLALYGNKAATPYNDQKNKT